MLQTRTASGLPRDMQLNYSKRLMLVSGRANPGLAARIGAKLGVEVSETILTTFSNGEV
jgi:ribose-phosphate pyrophosphokinase